MPHMMTSSNGNIFRVTGPLCGEFTGPGEFPTQRSVTRSFDVLFDLRLNRRLSKQPRGWWFETPSWPLWRQCNDVSYHRSVRSHRARCCMRNLNICQYDIIVNYLKHNRHSVRNSGRHTYPQTGMIYIMRITGISPWMPRIDSG